MLPLHLFEFTGPASPQERDDARRIAHMLADYIPSREGANISNLNLRGPNMQPFHRIEVTEGGKHVAFVWPTHAKDTHGWPLNIELLCRFDEDRGLYSCRVMLKRRGFDARHEPEVRPLRYGRAGSVPCDHWREEGFVAFVGQHLAKAVHDMMPGIAEARRVVDDLVRQQRRPFYGLSMMELAMLTARGPR